MSVVTRVRTLDPLTLGPALWLDDTGSDASVWIDKSGNGRHATQGNTSAQPQIVSSVLNGRQVRRFDGSNQFLKTGVLSTTIQQPVLWFVVFKALSIIQRRIFDVETISGTTGPRNTILLDGVASHLYAGQVLTTSFSSTSWGITEAIFDGLSSSWRHNGVALATGNAGTEGCSSIVIGTFRLLNSQFFQGDIAEIIIYPYALTSYERQLVEGYLSYKYAIPVA